MVFTRLVRRMPASMNSFAEAPVGHQQPRAASGAEPLNSFDRFVFGLGSLFVPASRIPQLASHPEAQNLVQIPRGAQETQISVAFLVGWSSPPRPKRAIGGTHEAIVEFKRRNPRIGCPRIAQEIARAFGIDIDKDIVRRVLAETLSTRSRNRWSVLAEFLSGI